MNGAFITSDDTSTSIVAGEAWGGGGTVNWSASLQPQGYVYILSKNNPHKHTANHLQPPRMVRRRPPLLHQRLLPRLARPRLRPHGRKHRVHRTQPRQRHVSPLPFQFKKKNPTKPPNFSSLPKRLLEGARKLGYAHKPVPQNTGGAQHRCGHCTFGCGSCEKQGPVISYLPDAARAGANFLEGFHAERIIFSNTIGGEKVATGLIGSWASRDENGGVAGTPLVRRNVLLKAKRIIVSAGTMQSPLLLLRSGLTNPQIGRNLHVHPVSMLGSIHKEEISPWDGAILTSVVSEYENLDLRGHGAKLEVTNMIPSSWLIWLDWAGGLQYKLAAARMKHMAGYISIARDRDTGRVYPDPVDGRVRFSYTPSAFDKGNIMQGLLALARIQYIEGAEEIFTTIPGMPSFKRSPSTSDPEPDSGDGINDTAFQTWLKLLENHGFPTPESGFVSAHQMGTCRMSSTQRGGVVDPTGKVWGTEGLYVADASVFPSASGVNPMVTNMAIADWISRGVAEGLRRRALL